MHSFVSDQRTIAHLFEAVDNLPPQTDTSQRIGSTSRVQYQAVVQDTGLMRIPTTESLRQFTDLFDTFVLYRYHGVANQFSFFVQLTKRTGLEDIKNLAEAILTNIVGGADNLSKLTLIPIPSTMKKDRLAAKLQTIAGKQMANMLVNYQRGVTLKQEESKLQGTFSNDYGSVFNHSQGKPFNVQQFQVECLRVVENLLLFSNHEIVRQIQTNPDPVVQLSQLRLFDNRYILQDIWASAITFTIQQPKYKCLQTLFTQEQICTLYNYSFTSLSQIFNSLVLGGATIIVQPHPIRALLEHIPTLTNTVCFDLGWYNYQQSGLNWLVAGFFIAKNFLTSDNHLSNNMGAVCLAGAPGSSKSRLQHVVYQFMNGFLYQDSAKGFCEFQNQDIVQKAFIRVEEIKMDRLASSDWKVLADIELSLKCKIKNKQDVEVTKFVPVMATTNDEIYETIIKKASETSNFEAAHRKWGFIRYFISWREGHSQLHTADGQFRAEFDKYYRTPDTDKQLMNALISCALLFTEQHFQVIDYVIPYYAHCLRYFSQTFFGYVTLKYRDIFVRQAMKAVEIYWSAPYKPCVDMQGMAYQDYERLCYTELATMTFQVDLGEDDDLYVIIMKVSQDPQFALSLTVAGELVLTQFLKEMKSRGNLLFELIYQELFPFDLLTDYQQKRVEVQVAIERPRKNSLDAGDQSKDFSLNEMSNKYSEFKLF